MSGFEFNKMFGALLVAGLIAIGIGKLTNILYHDNVQPEKRGYSIEVAEASTNANAAKAKDEVVNIAAYLAAGDVAKGEKTTKACAACHTFNKGGANKVGPNLWNMVNAVRANNSDFKYSKAMAAMSSEVWDFQALSEFLTKPKKFVKGTKMAYAGIKNPEKRADLLIYLRSLSDSPAVIPAPPAVEVPEVEAEIEDKAKAEAEPKAVETIEDKVKLEIAK